MILFAASVKIFFSNWHIVIYFFLWRWRGLLDLVHKSRHRRFARHAWYCDPLSFILDTPLSKFCLIYADIFYQISINLIRLTDWPTLYFFLHCFTFFYWQIRLGKEVTGDSTPLLTPPSQPMPRSRPILSHRVYLSQVNFSEVSSFAIWTCFIIYTTKIRQISKTRKKKLYRPNLS